MQTRNRFTLPIVLLLVLAVGIASYASSVTTGQSNRRFIGSVTRQVINDATGSVTLVPAIPGKRIMILGATLAGGTGVTTMEFLSGTNTLTYAMSINALQIDPPFGTQGQSDMIPWLEGNAGEPIILNLNGALQVSGQVIWTAAP
jgi:hypothetical protein